MVNEDEDGLLTTDSVTNSRPNLTKRRLILQTVQEAAFNFFLAVLDANLFCPQLKYGTVDNTSSS